MISRLLLAERIVSTKESFPDGYPHRGIPVSFKPDEWTEVVKALLESSDPTPEMLLAAMSAHRRWEAGDLSGNYFTKIFQAMMDARNK